MRVIILGAFLSFFIFFFFLPAGMAQTSSKEKIVVTLYPLYITVINIVDGHPNFEVTMMTGPNGGCLHDYSPSPADIKKVLGSTLIVANGAGLENFLDKILKSYPNIPIVQASEGYKLIKEEGGGSNPHLWASIDGAIFQAKKISEAILLNYPQYAELFKRNADRYIEKLVKLKKQMETDLAPYRGEKIITFHEAFPYFALEFNLEIKGVIELDPGREPSAKELMETTNLVKREKIKYLFVEPQYPRKIAEIISKESGAGLLTLDPAASGKLEQNAYIDIMKKNLSTLKDAFARP
ncbi:MAG: hypothetical protein A2504_05295 [Bdellovibrionales bacterium RIFOXYD12_FULL_39_22]|nr:MAG: hypothetical protein A2385_06530 [Bdellovibrionales bacterium RIFOXYB1_FULL_39_21]OFZ41933.1 MAG: hypothetical protein A2485_08500 [Bdellovibrionales bacterium RIFOXYC12_FULL_39_17]OFZ50649.1 MAG: hypothetical protein A2404_05450 [Bdellovibrionales bacterium RIFOXYC1_FULL_39_130]OFZ71893.1 MAG: hypothetical protein A2451_01805 [Bdellovibrionales bacterium RIFOXYC2_FULL_39_8]OFZ77872.1 MAG: hypothetical protein A2560_00620 [Bdellovibrionales bacterium RIFOXYD1_FULL_39_84]OFZ93692.1 MAG: